MKTNIEKAKGIAEALKVLGAEKYLPPEESYTAYRYGGKSIYFMLDQGIREMKVIKAYAGTIADDMCKHLFGEPNRVPAKGQECYNSWNI
jgi:hypothetical protein